MLFTRRNGRLLGFAAASLATLAGCFQTKAPLEYLGDEPIRYYQGQATRIDEPAVAASTNVDAVATDVPRTLGDRRNDEVWNMPLAEAIHVALKNATVIRGNGTFRAAGSPLLSNGTLAPTILDPAIQATAVNGQQGVEAALSAFDADFVSSMTWGRNETVQNSPFSPAGFGVVLPTVAQETAAFNAGLGKRFANGGALDLTHTMNYLGVPPGLFPFPSAYSGNVTLGYRQPLWAGGGVDFTRISGPINEQTGLTRNTVGEGVVLARINENISLDDFEAEVRNFVLDVEFVYWDLYLQYRLYNAAIVARNSARETWWNLKRTIDLGGDPNRPSLVAEEAQARDQYYAARAATEQSLAAVYSTEVRLRRLLALPVNDGRVIRPSDEPLTASYDVDWYAALAESMVERVELRKQKWNIKSLELQLRAARNLVNPRFDFVSGYNVNAFGDQLLGYGSDNDVANSREGYRYAYESLTQGNQTGWTLGFEFSVPLGFRHANTQVRNFELQLVKARDVLSAQELDISHELATSFQAVAEHYQRALTNYNRRRAAVDRLTTAEGLNREGIQGVDSTDLVLRAQTSLAQAERDYFTSLVDYNKAIADLQFRKGTLLEYNKVFLTEGAWDPQAYALARRRAEARSNAFDADGLLHSEPRPFASPVPTHGVELTPFGPSGPEGPDELIPLPDPNGLDTIPVGPEDNMPANPAPGPAPPQPPVLESRANVAPRPGLAAIGTTRRTRPVRTATMPNHDAMADIPIARPASRPGAPESTASRPVRSTTTIDTANFVRRPSEPRSEIVRTSAERLEDREHTAEPVRRPTTSRFPVPQREPLPAPQPKASGEDDAAAGFDPKFELDFDPLWK